MINRFQPNENHKENSEIEFKLEDEDYSIQEPLEAE